MGEVGVGEKLRATIPTVWWPLLEKNVGIGLSVQIAVGSGRKGESKCGGMAVAPQLKLELQ